MKTLQAIIEGFKAQGVAPCVLRLMQGLYDLGWRDEYLLGIIHAEALEYPLEAKQIMEGAIFHAAFSSFGPPVLTILKRIAWTQDAAVGAYEMQYMQLLIDLGWIDINGVMDDAARAYVQDMTSRVEKRLLVSAED